jgi:hypothetical protein
MNSQAANSAGGGAEDEDVQSTAQRVQQLESLLLLTIQETEEGEQLQNEEGGVRAWKIALALSRELAAEA